MKILNRAQIRAAEFNMAESGKASYQELMKNAGLSASKLISERYSVCGKKILIVCGRGNNGGDGLVIAEALSLLGAEVRLYCPFGIPATDTASAFGNTVSRIKLTDKIERCEVLIDALFGTGLDRPVEGKAEEVIENMNKSNAIKIAVDVPSGVPCDGEYSPPKAFSADFTVTFIALKPCFVLPTTSEFCGEYAVSNIGVESGETAYNTIEAPKEFKRPKNSHKGSYGTALIVCGSYGMCGAEILASRAALASGVGIVKAVVCDKNYGPFCVSVPEAVTIPVPTTEDGAPELSEKGLMNALESSDSVLLGCGLGKSQTSQKLVMRILLNTDIPVIVDADGINAVSANINIIGKIKAPVILTPHPAEMARLCHTSVSKIESNRVFYASQFAKQYGCVVVLKGSNTVVTSPDGKVFFNVTGNPGMATGGSGDVLSGMIAAFLAQGIKPLDAALKAVYLHGAAADSAVTRITQAGLIPSDIIEELKKLPQ